MRRIALLVLSVGAGLCLAADVASAGSRMLRGLALRSRGEITVVQLQLATPMRMLRHSPASEGSWVRIELEPLGRAGALVGYPNELRRPPAGIDSPLEEVAFQVRAGGGRPGASADLDLRFDRRVRFTVSPGKDLRSLLVTLEPAPVEEAPLEKAAGAEEQAAGAEEKAAAAEPSEPQAPPTPIPGATPAAPARTANTDPALADDLVSSGRAALQAGELDRAVLILGEAAAMPPHPRSAEARELLGVARERNGQLAHARAEYDAYLEEFPDDPGAERVRQRLDAMLTAAENPRPPLREAADSQGRVQTSSANATPRSPLSNLKAYGSLYTSYSRVERESEGSGRSLDDSSFFHDIFARASLQTDGVDLRGELSASYIFDLVDGDDDWRISNLFVEVEPRRSRFSGAFGRLPGNRAGVLGRFDGVRLRYLATPKVAVNAVSGMPFDPFIETGVDPSRVFVGGSVEMNGLLLEDLRLELFAIQQWADGIRDRSGVGAEFSWTQRGRFLAGILDYDVAFGELNTAFLVGTWQVRPGTTINALLDQRRLPTLTRRVALVGQTEDSLADLRRRFSTGELDDLALDRSVQSRSATLGVTQQLTARLQLAGEINLNDFTGTPESGGVGAFPDSGLQVGSFLQLLVSDLLREGDVVTVGVRNVQSRDLDLWLLELHWRAALNRRLRVDPFMRIEHRDQVVTGAVLVYRPGLRVDYRVGAFNVDAEFSYGWGQGERFLGEGDEEGYFMLVGARWDF